MKPKQVTDDLEKLLEVLPQAVQEALSTKASQEELLEIVLDLGRLPQRGGHRDRRGAAARAP